MSYFKKNKKGIMIGTSTISLALSGTDTYEKITGNFTEQSSHQFSVDDTNDKITYNGIETITCLMILSAEISLGNISTATLGVYRNGSIITNCEVSVENITANQKLVVSLPMFIDVAKNDYFEVYGKSDSAGTTITCERLKLMFWGEL